FTCDGSLSRPPRLEAWTRAMRIAFEALSGRRYEPVGDATHYHTRAVLPYWSHSMNKLTAIGAHVFYDNGASGRLFLPTVLSFATGAPRTQRMLVDDGDQP